MAGEVIGINTAIATGTGSYAGVGFALPSNTAIQVYNQIVKTGRVVRGAGDPYKQPPAKLLTKPGSSSAVPVLPGGLGVVWKSEPCA